MSVRAWWDVSCDFAGCACRTVGEPTRALAVAQAKAIGWTPPHRVTSIGGHRYTQGWICLGHTGSDFIDPHRRCEADTRLPAGARLVDVVPRTNG